MSSDHSAMGEAGRSALAWLGLALMAISFIWWQLAPRAEQSAATAAPASAPFNLVILDPGHGGQDSGAICGGIPEKDLTLDIAQRADRFLQTQGIATVFTRIGDTYVSLADRAALANRTRGCVFVSIHFNEGNKNISNGVETYYAERQLTPAKPVLAWFPFLQR